VPKLQEEVDRTDRKTLQSQIPRTRKRLQVREQQVKIRPTPFRKQTRNWSNGKHNARYTRKKGKMMETLEKFYM
jgi:hypothetical protein